MAVTATPIFPQTLQATGTAFVNATSTTATTIVTAGANGARIDKILLTNTDTSAYTCQFYIRLSSTDYLIGTVSCPISAGNLTTANAVDALSAGNLPLIRDSNGNLYLYLPPSATMKMAVTVAVTAAKTLAVTVLSGDY